MRTLPQIVLVILALASLGQAPGARGGTITGHVNAVQGGKPIELADVWVYLKPLGKPRPSLGKDVRVEIVQQRKQFRQPVTVVPLGATVFFPNRDKDEHNVFSPSIGAWLGFDLGRYRTDQKGKSYTFLELGEFDIYCDIHPNMAAKVKVVPSRYFTRVVAGAYRFADVPPGSYQVVAWSPNSSEPGPETVEVKAGENRSVFTINLQYRKRSTAHLRKDGRDYEPY